MNIKITAGLSALLLSAPALAQTAPPGGNLDDRVRQQSRPLTEAEQVEAAMTGDTDILLLRRTRLFALAGSMDLTTTSNAALGPQDEHADTFAQVQAGLGAGIRLGGRVDLFANLGITHVRYFNQTALDYSAATGIVGARAAIGGFTLAATYQPAVVFDRDFSSRQLTTHRLRLEASRPLRWRRLTIEPEVHAERAISHPGDYSAWSAGAGLTVSAAPLRNPRVLVYAQAGYDRRSFDDYFTAFVGTRRIDDTLGAGVGVVWRPRNWGEVRASYSFGRNWSTSDVNGYTAHSGTIGLSATLRF